MPQSITIAAFVLGAVLLLIALLGGNFKIFGAEVSGSPGQGPRMLAGGLGVLFIAIGLLGSLGSSKPDAEQRETPPTHEQGPTTRGSGGSAQPPGVERQSPPEAARPVREELPNIAGEWRDETGSRYQITQNGSRFEFQAFNPGIGVSSRGSGEILGRQLTNSFLIDTPQGPARGAGSGSISADGRTMIGTFTDAYYGQYSRTLTRVP